MINSLSIIFPVYNEADRLKKSLKKINKFFVQNLFKDVEIIFVDDGSFDNSSTIIQKFISKNSLLPNIHLKFIKLEKNCGKGYALKQGVKYASKKWLLTLDIDLSVSLDEIILWKKNNYIINECNVYFGSRLIKGSKVKKNIIRNLFGILFRFIVVLLFGTSVLDTQCGFKLYKTNFAKKIFSNIYSNGFCHDIEIFLICRKLKYNIKELPVRWVHKNYGKVNIFYHPVLMFIDLIKIYFYKNNK